MFNEKAPDAYAPFLKLLSKEDEYIQLKSAKILTHLLSSASNSSDTDPTEFFRWLILQLASTNPQISDISLQLLQTLLGKDSYRLKFYETEGAISG